MPKLSDFIFRKHEISTMARISSEFLKLRTRYLYSNISRTPFLNKNVSIANSSENGLSNRCYAETGLSNRCYTKIFHICSCIGILSLHTKFQPPMTISRKPVWVTLVGPTRQKILKIFIIFHVHKSFGPCIP